MAHEYTYEQKGLFVRFYGTVTPADIRAMETKVWSSPLWDRSLYSIVDFTDVEELTLEERHAQDFAYLDNASMRSTRNNKVALIATAPSILALMEVYYETARDLNFEARIFSSLEQARAWAGVYDPKNMQTARI